MDFEEVEPEEEEAMKKNPSVKQFFFHSTGAKEDTGKRHKFFTERGLEPAEAF